MKYNYIIKASVAIFVAIIFQGCYIKKMIKMSKDQKLVVNPSPLELHGDSVKFDISLELPIKMLKTNKNYRYTLSYKTADQRLAIGKFEFKGNDYPKASTESPKLKKKFSFAYAPDLVKGDLLGFGYAFGLNDKGKKSLDLPVAKGIATTSKLLLPITPVAYTDHGYSDKDEYVPSVITFYFDKKSTEINEASLNSQQVKNFEKSITKKFVTKNVTIIATNSPEGSFTYNAILAEERAVAIENFYKKMMKKYNYGTLADSISFTTKSRPQEWAYYKPYFDVNQTLTQGQKDTIEMIMTDKTGTIRSNEVKLHELPYYQVIVNEVYSLLRSARTEAISLKVKKTTTEILEIADKIINKKAKKDDVLNEQELMYAAKLTEDKDKKEILYKAATKQNDNWISHNNLGALYLEKAIKEEKKMLMEEYSEKAMAQFEIARKNFESPITLLNAASARLLNNDFEKADEYASKGLSLKTDGDVLKGLNAIKGVTEMKKGLYKSAINLLSNATSQNEVNYNKGLAQVMNHDYKNAEKTFDLAAKNDSKNALLFYVAAVNCARQKDDVKCYELLKKAIAIDKMYLKKSTEDIEFSEMYLQESFKSLMNQ